MGELRMKKYFKYKFKRPEAGLKVTDVTWLEFVTKDKEKRRILNRNSRISHPQTEIF